jgi:hypothetical protein
MENIQPKLWFSGPFVALFGSKIWKKCCCKWQVVFCNLSQLYVDPQKKTDTTALIKTGEFLNVGTYFSKPHLTKN